MLGDLLASILLSCGLFRFCLLWGLLSVLPLSLACGKRLPLLSTATYLGKKKAPLPRINFQDYLDEYYIWSCFTGKTTLCINYLMMPDLSVRLLLFDRSRSHTHPSVFVGMRKWKIPIHPTRKQHWIDLSLFIMTRIKQIRAYTRTIRYWPVCFHKTQKLYQWLKMKLGNDYQLISL